MRRFLGTLLGLLLGTLLVAHAGVLVSAGSSSGWSMAGIGADWKGNAAWLLASLGAALLGRLVLSLFPPGEPGFHDPRHLPETWAASLGLGALLVAWAWESLVRAAHALAAPGAPASRVPFWLALCTLLGLAAVRAATLPGAMVPRHSVERREGRWCWLVAALVLAWLAAAFVRPDFAPSLAWLALVVLLERGLARARRAALGRALFLLTLVALPAFPLVARNDLWRLHSAPGLGFALGAGSAFLIPWLRRADRRAGALAAFFFGAVFLHGPDPLALAGPLVLVVASHRAQRGFAVRVALGAALAGGAVGLALGPSPLPRERLLLAEELLRAGLESGLWGLAWPLVLAGLVLGAARFPWRAPAWSPGTIEAPRREGLALLALLGTLAAALSLPSSPWAEGETLLILFPPAALLAGLLLLASERPVG